MFDFKNKSIKSKIVISVGFSSVVLIVILFAYTLFTVRTKVFESSKKQINATTTEFVSNLKLKILASFEVTHTLNNSFKSYRFIPEAKRREVFSEMVKNVLINNPDLIAVWSIWEPNALDNLDSKYIDEHYKNSGRFTTCYYRVGGVISEELYQETDEELAQVEYYSISKNTKADAMLAPYFYSYSQDKKNEVFETSIVTPIIENGNFLGVIGVDVDLTSYQDLINQFAPSSNSSVFLLSNNGTFVSNPNVAVIGKSIEDIYPELNKEYFISDKIKKGEKYFIDNLIFEENKKNSHLSLLPLNFGYIDTPWSLLSITSLDYTIKEANQIVLIAVALIGIIILLFTIHFISVLITRPFIKTSSVLKSLAQGEIKDTDKIEITHHDEFMDMALSLNILIDSLKKTANFAQEIGRGKLQTEYKLLSEKDILGNSLLEMRKSLTESRHDDEIRKQQDALQNWATLGLAKFAEILRQNQDSIRDMGYNILSNLVYYLNINQGGLFVINDDNKENIFLELVAAFAYDRKKLVKKTIQIREGLVGACALEKQTIYMNNIPYDYINITSGIGKAVPTCLLIVPLVKDDKVLGVVELASLEEIEKHKIDFVERLGESIATTLANVKINEQTTKLLAQFRQQQEEMAAQEEEMRQNLEELQTTQDDLRNKTEELERIRIVEHERAERVISEQKELSSKTIKELRDKEKKLVEHNKTLEEELKKFRKLN